MKKQYITPATYTLDISVENQILAMSEIHVEEDDKTDKFDAPSRKDFGDLWSSKGWQ